MTAATGITVLRILLIPVFVLFCLYASAGDRADVPTGNWGFCALVVFLVAALSDWLDGFVARRFNQESQLGKILDPLADKGLMLSALLLLTFLPPYRLPLWYAVLTISRDLLVFAGVYAIRQTYGRVTLRAHWTGKTATFLQMTSIAWVLLGFPHQAYVVIPAAVFTVLSGVIYLLDGWRQSLAFHDPTDKSH